MNLIIFDIDGTLTQTNEIDSICFAQAIEDVLKIKDLNTDWASYRYSTDSGLLKEICRSYFKRVPTQKEVSSIQECFVDYLNDAWTANRSLFIPIPGADKIFQEVSTLSQWHVGIATGGWKKSALFKLDAANIPHAVVPKAYADDHIERTEIIKITIKHAQAINNIKQYHQIVYVGDRPWDERAAMQLGIGFISMGSQINNHFYLNDYNNQSLIHYLEKIQKI